MRLYQRDKHKLAYTHRESSAYSTLRHIDVQSEICIFSACTGALYNFNCQDTCHNINCNHVLNTSSFFILFSVFVLIFSKLPPNFCRHMPRCVFDLTLSFSSLNTFCKPTSSSVCHRSFTYKHHTHTHSLFLPPHRSST